MRLLFFRFGRVARGQDIRRFARAVCRKARELRREGELSIVLLSDRQIRVINRKFLDHDRATDVIAFRYPAAPKGAKGGPAPFGDVYVSLDHARRQARWGKYPCEQEVALLVCHGLLHLAGYRDDRPALKKKMFARQRALLAAIDASLAPPDFR